MNGLDLILIAANILLITAIAIKRAKATRRKQQRTLTLSAIRRIEAPSNQQYAYERIKRTYLK